MRSSRFEFIPLSSGEVAGAVRTSLPVAIATGPFSPEERGSLEREVFANSLCCIATAAMLWPRHS
jgi:hypothetical protein